MFVCAREEAATKSDPTLPQSSSFNCCSPHLKREHFSNHMWVVCPRPVRHSDGAAHPPDLARLHPHRQHRHPPTLSLLLLHLLLLILLLRRASNGWSIRYPLHQIWCEADCFGWLSVGTQSQRSKCTTITTATVAAATTDAAAIKEVNCCLWR